jgi:protease-4
MKSFLKIFLSVLLSFFLMFFLLIGFMSLLADDAPEVPEEAYLTIPLKGSVPDFAQQSPFDEALGQSPVTAFGIYENLYKAALDDRIKGVLIKGGGVSVSLGNAQEIIAAIDRFKEQSGKPVYFFAEMLTNRDLYIAASCDSIFVVPEGLVAITGMSGSSVHVKNALKNAGIEADFVHMGKYKNYPEVFTRSTMSDDQREVIDDMLGYAWPDYLRRLAAKAGKSPELVEQDIASGILTPQLAFELGYVDTLYYRDQVLDLFAEAKAVSYGLYSKVSRKSVNGYKGAKIAIVFANGSIMTGDDSEDPIMGNSMGSDRVSADLRAAAKEKSVKAIVLRIDSPGGMASASDIIWREIENAKEKKPVIVSVGGVCASGGYYMAMAGDSVIAHEGSVMGSIGVFAGKFVARELLEEKIGINSEVVTRGEFSQLFNARRKFSRKEREVMSRDMKVFYERFVAKVAEGRNLPLEQVKTIAEGRVWFGPKNKEIGLTDSFGNLDDAFRAALQKAGYDRDADYKWKVFPKKSDFLTELQKQGIRYSEAPIEKVEKWWLKYAHGPALYAWYPHLLTIE